jgi:hypothetical protein
VFRILALLMLLAGGLVGSLVLLGSGSVVTETAARAGEPGTRTAIDIMSFTLGFGAGALMFWIYSVPWLSGPRMMFGWMMGWRRAMMMTTLAIAGTCILLFY